MVIIRAGSATAGLRSASANRFLLVNQDLSTRLLCWSLFADRGMDGSHGGQPMELFSNNRAAFFLVFLLFYASNAFATHWTTRKVKCEFQEIYSHNDIRTGYSGEFSVDLKADTDQKGDPSTKVRNVVVKVRGSIRLPNGDVRRFKGKMSGRHLEVDRGVTNAQYDYLTAFGPNGTSLIQGLMVDFNDEKPNALVHFSIPVQNHGNVHSAAADCVW